MQGLDGPAVLHKALGQVIQQLSVDGHVAGLAPVVGRAHQRFAEMPLPHAVHEHPRRHWVRFARQPSGQLQASAALLRRLLGISGQHYREDFGHRLSAAVMVAPDEHLLTDGRSIGYRAGQIGLLAQTLLKDVELAPQLRHPFAIGQFHGPAVEGDGGEERLGFGVRFGASRDIAVLGDFDGQSLAPTGEFGVPLLGRFLVLLPILARHVGPGGGRGIEPFFQVRGLRLGVRGFQPFRPLGGRRHKLGQLGAQQGVLARMVFVQRVLEFDLLRQHAPALRLIAIIGHRVQRRVVQVRNRSGTAQIAESGGAGKDGSQRIIILGKDGIELVVVAAGAGHREPQERFRGGIDLFVHHVVNHLHPILLRQRFGSKRQKSSGDDAPYVVGWIVGGKQVAGDLLLHEPVVRDVLVERLDHVVAVAPSVRVDMVFVHAGGVGVAGDVQP